MPNDDIVWIYLWNTVKKVKIPAVEQTKINILSEVQKSEILKQATFHAGDFVIYKSLLRLQNLFI